MQFREQENMSYFFLIYIFLVFLINSVSFSHLNFYIQMPQKEILDLFKQRLYSDPQWQKEWTCQF